MAGKPAGEAAPKKEAPAQQPQGQPQQHSGGDKQSSKKKHEPLVGMCHCMGCKSQSTRFNFCEEHFEHFKFGLIKKTGERVPDYEKKIEHFMAHQKKTAMPMRKAA